MFPIWHWHIENSSICSLRCPRCPRQEVPDSLIQTSLSLDFFKKNFDETLIKDVWQISFCGDDGDPIYGQDFLDIVLYLKNLKPNLSLRIITNGSYKKSWWWYNLARALNQYDEIHFSIDGWNQETNQQYRVNSDWQSIMDAVKTLRANTTAIMVMDTIVFAFNETEIYKSMQSLAERLGFDRYQITKSTKFGSVYPHYLNSDGVDTLEPKAMISTTKRFQRILINLNGREQLDNDKNKLNQHIWENTNTNSEIIPLCQIGNKGLYITADGYFYPCCWMANRYNHTNWQRFKTDDFNLNIRSIIDVINDKKWQEFFSTLHTNTECSTKCAKINFNQDYATQW